MSYLSQFVAWLNTIRSSTQSLVNNRIFAEVPNTMRIQCLYNPLAIAVTTPRKPPSSIRRGAYLGTKAT